MLRLWQNLSIIDLSIHRTFFAAVLSRNRNQTCFRHGSNVVFHMRRIECKLANRIVFAHLHSIRRMWNTTFDPYLNSVLRFSYVPTEMSISCSLLSPNHYSCSLCTCQNTWGSPWGRTTAPSSLSCKCITTIPTKHQVCPVKIRYDEPTALTHWLHAVTWSFPDPSLSRRSKEIVPTARCDIELCHRLFRHTELIPSKCLSSFLCGSLFIVDIYKLLVAI